MEAFDKLCRFDFTVANVNDSNFEKLKPADLPDVVCVVLQLWCGLTLCEVIAFEPESYRIISCHTDPCQKGVC